MFIQDVRCPLQYPIVALSHTCRRWRSIALDSACAGCWSTIPVNNVEWTRLCLSRSRNFPFSMCVADDGLDTLFTTGPMVKPQRQLSRLEQAFFFFIDLTHDSDIPDHFWDFICRPMPNVTSLRLSFNREMESWVNLPNDLLAG